MELPPAKGDLEITVDANGQVFLRGVVASAEVAREIEQTAWSVPGVSRVVAQLQVRPRPADPAARDESPPPLPVPAQPDRLMVPPRPDPQAHAEQPDNAPRQPAPEPQPPPAAHAPAAAPRAASIAVAARDTQRLTRRVAESLKRRPALASQPIEVRSAGESASLSGKVPSAYEAMLAFRAAQQTPGVREIIDRLEFPVPDEDHPNPLVRRGRPEDIEPYVAAQMTRHLGELADIDSVKARGNHLEIRGTLLDAADHDRVLAIVPARSLCCTASPSMRHSPPIDRSAGSRGPSPARPGGLRPCSTELLPNTSRHRNIGLPRKVSFTRLGSRDNLCGAGMTT